jgi:hypothetical protein
VQILIIIASVLLIVWVSREAKKTDFQKNPSTGVFLTLAIVGWSVTLAFSTTLVYTFIQEFAVITAAWSFAFAVVIFFRMLDFFDDGKKGKGSLYFVLLLLAIGSGTCSCILLHQGTAITTAT